MDKWDAEANKLLGTRLTPATVWNLAPWSWALDWFTNTGDVVTNLSAFANDGLCLRYGYIMEEVSTRNTGCWQGYINTRDSANVFIKIEESFGSTTKKRQPATPFGFGLELGSFTPRQMAITAALGLSNAPRPTL